MKRIMSLALLCILVLAAFSGNAFSAYTVLHNFEGEANGGVPWGSLIVVDSTLYGMTSKGGYSRDGVIFRINANGTGYEELQSFDSDGEPKGSLVSDGSALYGMTEFGGLVDGSIFKINVDGSGYEELFLFDLNHGCQPQGTLIHDGSILYGMTQCGGANLVGVVFKMNTDGTGYELLHEFAGGSDDGFQPQGSPLLIGSSLYGMTAFGGDSNDGVIFKVNTDGTGYELLHEFAGGPDDGTWPQGTLILAGSSLYGMTTYGGDNGYGVIFKVNMDGSGYELLHEFTGESDDGRYPGDSLLAIGSTLYGMTRRGGASDCGVIFKIKMDGTGFESLHDFAGEPVDGESAHGSLILAGSRLYGMTAEGGAHDQGVIFSLDLFDSNAQPIPTLSEWGVIILAVLLAFAAFVLIKRQALNSTRPV